MVLQLLSYKMVDLIKDVEVCLINISAITHINTHSQIQTQAHASYRLSDMMHTDIHKQTHIYLLRHPRTSHRYKHTQTHTSYIGRHTQTHRIHGIHTETLIHTCTHTNMFIGKHNMQTHTHIQCTYTHSHAHKHMHTLELGDISI